MFSVKYSYKHGIYNFKIFNLVIQAFWPKDLGPKVAPFFMLCQKKKVCFGKQSVLIVIGEKPHGLMLFPQVPEGRCYQRRCDSAPVLQDYKQNLKQLI